jgi:hypothetical protein
LEKIEEVELNLGVPLLIAALQSFRKLPEQLEKPQYSKQLQDMLIFVKCSMRCFDPSLRCRRSPA